MKRRHFLLSSIGAAASARASTRIVRITVTPIQGRFHKFVAMNSYDVEPKGHTYTNSLVRIRTAEGIEGIGSGIRTDQEFLSDARALLGADPLAIYEMDQGRIMGRKPPYEALLKRHRHLDGPLFDLVGKLTGKPCWNLIGDAARERIEVYDGTLYFSDIWFGDRGVRAVVEEAEESARSGYKAMKLKVGRGWKWMERQPGLERDIAVLNAARAAIGPDVKLLADANNGYRGDFERAWQLLEGTAASKLHFMEEIFPEDVEQYTRLREKMAQAGIRTLIADGETVREPEALHPFLKPKRLVDVLQYDIRVGGFLDNVWLARAAQEAGAVSVPHNWASRIGLLMGLHLSKAVESIPAAEDDRSTCDVVIEDGYRFRDGHWTVSDAPGLGIRLDEKVYDKKYRANETVLA